MADEPQNAEPSIVAAYEPIEDVHVQVLDTGVIRIVGELGEMTGLGARQLAYALMSAGAKV